MKKPTFFLTLLALIMVLAAAIARIIYSVYSLNQPNSQEQRPPPASSASPKKAVASPKSPEVKRPPPPREVYWSAFSKHLLQLEQQRATIMTTLAPASIAAQPEKVVTESDVKIEEESPVPSLQPADITWTVVGQQVLELEKQRERTFTLLAD